MGSDESRFLIRNSRVLLVDDSILVQNLCKSWKLVFLSFRSRIALLAKDSHLQS